MILKNKRGAEKILAVYWFAILVLVSAGVFSIVFSFQSPYDVRGLESSILAGKVADCISEQGVLEQDIVKNLGISSMEEVLDPVDKGELIEAMLLVNKTTFGKTYCYCGRDGNPPCEDYVPWIMSASEENNIVDPLLLLSLMMQESRCIPGSASGSSGGLMQVNWGTHCKPEFGLPINIEECKQILRDDLPKNIQVGAQSLRANYDKHKENGFIFKKAKSGGLTSCLRTEDTKYLGWEAALRVYNGGGCGVYLIGEKKGELIVKQDDFVEDVVGRYSELRVAIGKSPISGKLVYDLMNKCKFNFDNLEKEDQYYFEAEIINFTTGKTINTAWEGNRKFETACRIIQNEEEQKTQAKCVKRSFYSVDEDNGKYLIKILSAVGNIVQNVK